MPDHLQPLLNIAESQTLTRTQIEQIKKLEEQVTANVEESESTQLPPISSQQNEVAKLEEPVSSRRAVDLRLVPSPRLKNISKSQTRLKRPFKTQFESS